MRTSSKSLFPIGQCVPIINPPLYAKELPRSEGRNMPPQKTAEEILWNNCLPPKSKSATLTLPWCALFDLGGKQLFHNISSDRKSTRLNSSHVRISYAVFCLKKK